MSPDPSNKELQRETAVVYRNEWQPVVEKIRFTQEGDRPGFGASWSVNAVATVLGVEYQVIIGPDIGPAYVGGSDVPPESPPTTPSGPLTVIYSDGTTEVIE
ncbi:hypothetical protein SAMN04515692_12425 [Leifsonia sp. CL147]|nr:hypothetical protein SAMN04515694_12433 [Leifsonia sp. CL154]SFM05864.1 hypothetical protein SAMN04515692_12425 [Leifsonia sp. CL147]